MSTQTGPKSLQGSAAAKRIFALMLEVLSGIRSTMDAADGMGVALVRYYQLETRALQAMLEALEPRPRGRKAKTESEWKAEFAREKKQLNGEIARYKTLYRSLRRVAGVTAPTKKTGGKNGTRIRRLRKKGRGERVVAALLEQSVGSNDPVHNPQTTKEKEK